MRVFQSSETQVFLSVIVSLTGHPFLASFPPETFFLSFLQFQKKKLLEFYAEKRNDVSKLFGESYELPVAIARIFRGNVLYP